MAARLGLSVFATAATASAVLAVCLAAPALATPSTHVNWKETWAGLRRIDYQGMLVIEAFGQGLPGLAAATKIWRRMFVDEDQVAREGLAFMKRSWESR